MGIPMGLYFGGGWGGWGGWGWGFGWGGHNIMVNNSFIHRYNFNSRGIGSLNGTSAWSHDASHRQGVPYWNYAVSSRYRGNVRQNLQSRGASAGSAQSRGTAAQAQSRTAASQSGAERMGNRQVSRSAPNQSRSAFGGVREGSAARTQSDHGYSSLGPARSSGGGSAPRGGGAAPSRGGGGGGGGGNRGGGHR